MTRKQKRLSVIGGGMAFLALAAALTFYALGERTSYFYMPADLLANPVEPGQRFRLGGLVAKGTITRGEGTDVTFVVEDSLGTVNVTYSGILPDLFREEQGVVAEGRLDASGRFIADTVLARHDENYMPKEVADSLKAQGMWQHAE